jgi:small subunit ribosomal protein S20
MANTKSAAKNARKAIKRHQQRVTVKSELKTLRKKALNAAEANNSSEEIIAAVNAACSKYAKAASNKYIHPKTAARKISRLMKAVNKLQN